MEQDLTQLLMRWLVGGIRRKAEIEAITGRFVLSQSPRALWIARSITFGFLFFLVLCTVGQDFTTQLMGGLLFGLQAMAMIWWFYETNWTKVTFDEHALHVKRPTSISYSIHWESIDRFRFDSTMNWLVLSGQGSATVRVSVFSNGIGTFLTTSRSRMKDSVWQEMDALIKKRHQTFLA